MHEAGGQKIKPCPAHLLSCSCGAGISSSRENCVCVCVCRGALSLWCVLHLNETNKNTLATEKCDTHTHTPVYCKTLLFQALQTSRGSHFQRNSWIFSLQIHPTKNKQTNKILNIKIICYHWGKDVWHETSTSALSMKWSVVTVLWRPCWRTNSYDPKIFSVPLIPISFGPEGFSFPWVMKD